MRGPNQKTPIEVKSGGGEQSGMKRYLEVKARTWRMGRGISIQPYAGEVRDGGKRDGA